MKKKEHLHYHLLVRKCVSIDLILQLIQKQKNERENDKQLVANAVGEIVEELVKKVEKEILVKNVNIEEKNQRNQKEEEVLKCLQLIGNQLKEKLFLQEKNYLLLKH